MGCATDCATGCIVADLRGAVKKEMTGDSATSKGEIEKQSQNDQQGRKIKTTEKKVGRVLEEKKEDKSEI